VSTKQNNPRSVAGMKPKRGRTDYQDNHGIAPVVRACLEAARTRASVRRWEWEVDPSPD
jgi:hypothetical protein